MPLADIFVFKLSKKHNVDKDKLLVASLFKIYFLTSRKPRFEKSVMSANTCNLNVSEISIRRSLIETVLPLEKKKLENLSSIILLLNSGILIVYTKQKL